MGEKERDVVVLEALHHIPGEAAGVREDLNYCKHLRTLEGEPPRHDHPDVPGTEDHDPLPDHEVFEVDEMLGSPCCVDPCGSGPRDPDGSSRAFPAPHGKDDCACLYHLETIRCGSDDPPFRGKFQDHAVGQVGDP